MFLKKCGRNKKKNKGKFNNVKIASLNLRSLKSEEGPIEIKKGLRRIKFRCMKIY